MTTARRSSLLRTVDSCVFALPRALVSQNKRRFQGDGYDLDLCYLHPRVIVMGYPATGLEATYRNPRSAVQRFLVERHASRFKVFNFCSEATRRYPPEIFESRVEYIPVEDHNVPTLPQILSFCDRAAQWLDDDSENVVVLHCKAGKGRAGMMACMLLLRMKFASTATEAIDRYNQVRVIDRRGLTVISQRKWVHYYEQILSQIYQESPLDDNFSPHDAIDEPELIIEELVIQNALTGKSPPALRLRIFTLDNASSKKVLLHQTTGVERFLVHARVKGCVQLEFRSVKCHNCMTKKHFRVWFNTLFVQEKKTSGVFTFPRNTMDWSVRLGCLEHARPVANRLDLADAGNLRVKQDADRYVTEFEATCPGQRQYPPAKGVAYPTAGKSKRVLIEANLLVEVTTDELLLLPIAMAGVGGSTPKNSSLPRLVYPTAAKKQLPSTKDALTMNRVTSGISGVLETLQMKIDLLDREIRADESGKQEYDDQLFRLGERRRDLDNKLQQCRDWITTFESKIQPLEGKYDATTQLMQQQYEDAKLRHAQGIQVLIDQFDYHPEFKRYSDTFSAVPFRPK
ncbi:hypothetical protein P43SY_003654 [Pythium insidiosum]|uniref:Phosphatidylinositol-3,4,5-trisphosphate 3-phosphatase n=1 Tax=Pythium insidiosum TaxID=114742 RepID=A0AAD5LZF2_PYTIN|nr:hypothetical protein P43SY_003654 [Pythium insidiosum]